jgi:hypothetical protein
MALHSTPSLLIPCFLVHFLSPAIQHAFNRQPPATLPVPVCRLLHFLLLSEHGGQRPAKHTGFIPMSNLLQHFLSPHRFICFSGIRYRHLRHPPLSFQTVKLCLKESVM